MSFVDTNTDDWSNYIGPNGVPRIDVTPKQQLKEYEDLKYYADKLPVQGQAAPTTYIMEPDLVETQTGKVHTPPDVSFDDAGFAYNNVTGQPVQIIRRPNVLPIARTPDGYTFAMPKMLDAASNIVGGVAAPAVATKAGEVVLGSGAVKTAMEAAPTVTGPFYSGLERAVDAAKVNKADASQWLGYLKNQPGVKADEIGQVLKDLPQGPITKEQLQNIVQQNKVQLNEVVKGDLKELPEGYKIHKVEGGKNFSGQTQPDTYYVELPNGTTNKAYWQSPEAAMENMLNQFPKTKYHDYQLPGGENYQEMLLTLPDVKKPTGRYVVNFEANGIKQSLAFNTKSEANDIIKTLNDGKTDSPITNINLKEDLKSDPIANYRSSHWDEPNILAHVRYNDRNIPDVGKSLHLEEIQSDWHQAGRKHGYANNSSNSELDQLYRDVGGTKATPVPDAPFKKTWDELAFKRMLHKAATEGYDSISWTPGEAQAARYDLSKQLKELQYLKNDDGTYQIAGITAKGDGFNHPESVTAAKLPDVVGKDMAEKIINNEGKRARGHPANSGYFEGVDLKVGGEGMKSFYDKMLVDKANALAKKYGAKVETKNLKPKIDESVGYENHLEAKYGSNYKNQMTTEETKILNDLKNIKGQPVHVLKLTPELRAKAKEGFPLFSSTPVLTPVQGNPFEQREQPKYKLTPIEGNPFK